MYWYHYLSGFWAGMFLANFVPHFVKGVSGDLFPSPFSKPPGKGPSSPVVNVLWGLLNLVIGYFLFRAGKVTPDDNSSMLVFFAGVVCMSVMLAKSFAKKEKM